MIRTFVAAVMLCSVLGGCANGWPRARHPLRSPEVTANCVPTTSRIGRGDCATSTSGKQTSGTDIDRAGQLPTNLPQKPPGGRSP